MNFLQLLDGAEVLDERGDPPIAGLDYDSRRVRPGWCFVAMRGEHTDGNKYIDQAIANGAIAVVSDSLQPREGVAWARVPHGRRALARLSEAKRVPLLMAEVEGWSSEEIATALGVPIGTVWSRLHAARLEMRQVLEEGPTS